MGPDSLMLPETIDDLKKLAERHEAVAVAYSDGKDSRVVMDLAVRLFRRRIEGCVGIKHCSTEFPFPHEW
jgi:PP-loop superfamily ATP-utilizing enzyme